jgi:hypothetical protein
VKTAARKGVKMASQLERQRAGKTVVSTALMSAVQTEIQWAAL